MSTANKSVPLICIQCPLGCDLLLEKLGQDEFNLTGCSVPNCKAGRRYAIAEVTQPLRMVTTTVRIDGAEVPLVSVRTAQPIPKAKILSCLQQLRELRIRAPVERGAVIVPDIAETGIAMIATRSIAAAK